MSKATIHLRQLQSTEVSLRTQLAILLDQRDALASTQPDAADLISHIDDVATNDRRIAQVQTLLQAMPAKRDEALRAAVRERANAIAPEIAKLRKEAAEAVEAHMQEFEAHMHRAIQAIEQAFDSAGDAVGTIFSEVGQGDWNAIIAGTAAKSKVKNARALAFLRALVRVVDGQPVTESADGAAYPRRALMDACRRAVARAGQDAEAQARIELK